jgi:hypothetical protein
VGLTLNVPFRSEAFARGARMLRTALGPAIAGYLEDPSIVEVMLIPRAGSGSTGGRAGLRTPAAASPPADAERIVRLIADRPVRMSFYPGAR